MNRNLDGMLFRVSRNDEWETLSFSDLTEDEMRTVLTLKSKEWLTNACIELGKIIREIGDGFDLEGYIVGEDDGKTN